MNGNQISAMIVAGVALVLGAVSLITFLSGSIPVASITAGLLVVWVAYVALTSTWILRSDTMLLSFFISDIRVLYVTGAAWYERDENGVYVYRLAPAEGHPLYSSRGLFGTNVVLLLYPFLKGVYFPMTVVTLHLHGPTVFTREYLTSPDDEADIVQDLRGESPSLPVNVTVTIQFRLSPDLVSFVQAINVLSETHDLAEEVKIRDNLWSPEQDDLDVHTYTSPCLAGIIQSAVKAMALQAIRSVAGEMYTWDPILYRDGREFIRDIKSSLPQFADLIRAELARDRNGVFVQAGMLAQLTPEMQAQLDALYETRDRQHPAEAILDVAPGRSLISFDVRIDDVQPVQPEPGSVLEALTRPMIAKLTAEADKRQGIGKGDRLREIAARSRQVSGGDEIYRGEVLKEMNEVNLFGAGDTLTDLVRPFFQGKTDKPDGAETQGPETQQPE
ncbi:MAG: hypothetical protein COT71_02595 [Candidatus Andersenbacteria bacterium CG10_big_fil_rev_8_21_14_0_10_54_11]|uniref:Band 7 domain-containing protein n=1 Tax=Candidatus Andersenbacteria bacterium CG10_big_fil_rev_8_21_14_0_10_54_11 TaxID=1974485 RepID=A0A2M6WZ42_9BACT|nr:MAG: hypothetical protein COT71_02595 [Candidatus Andersenbacteria bacterium CG10_big_fil_rev_8_21_14_0_10_54_11]